MITEKDIVEVPLSVQELRMAYRYAKLAEIGGTSRIRNEEDRAANLSIDQFIGVGLGELAGNKYFFSVMDYCLSRKEKNNNPHAGDDGCDTLGHLIDYKASWAKKDDLLSYNLLVRPRERHAGHIYVLILVNTHWLKPLELVTGDKPPKVYLIGWASDDMLPAENEKSGMFGPRTGCNDGAYVLPAKALQPITSLKSIPKRES